jgi:Domain of unknown function (DUF1876)/Domain of unknown function (DUF1918)
MRAHPGDHIILAPPTVDAPMREGEVVEARGEHGAPPYVVRWSDGHEGLLYPGPGAVLRVTAPEEAEASTPPTAERPDTPAGAAPHARDWSVRVSVLGSDDDAEARVVLVADSPRQLTAHGHSHRSAGDLAVPAIGDEIAVARALRRLADQLLEAAADDIEAATGEHDVTLRPR